jgi:hypothetical protein
MDKYSHQLFTKVDVQLREQVTTSWRYEPNAGTGTITATRTGTPPSTSTSVADRVLFPCDFLQLVTNGPFAPMI